MMVVSGSRCIVEGRLVVDTGAQPTHFYSDESRMSDQQRREEKKIFKATEQPTTYAPISHPVVTNRSVTQ